MNNWSLRDEILTFSQRWYWIALIVVIGALLGWGISSILPSPHRATLDLYVGLDAYRATQDQYISAVAQEKFRNLDDYKNWQMLQLETLISSDDFLSETLAQLHQLDERWNSTDLETLRSILSASWRNAGVWHLAAETGDPGMAEQAVETWGEVIVEKVNLALSHARMVRLLDDQLVALAEDQAELFQRESVLTEIKAGTDNWQDDLQKMDADQPVSSTDSWKIAALAATAADWNPGWSAVLGSVPVPESFPADFVTWLDQLQPMIETELALVPGQIASLEAERNSVGEQYAAETEASLALSASLIVERPSNSEPQVAPSRPTGLATLAGGAIGVLLWFLWFLLRLSRKGSA
jgi:hypothetical protein